MPGAPGLLEGEADGFAADFTFSGAITATATLAVTEVGPDTVAFVGTVTPFATRTATLAVTEVGPDTAALAGAVAAAAVLATTEVEADAASIQISSAVAGTLAAVEVGTDVAAIVLRTRAVEANVGLAGRLAPTALLQARMPDGRLRGRI